MDGSKISQRPGLWAYASLIRSYFQYHTARKSKGGAILDKMVATKSIFVHVPKTGGKSIIQALYGLDPHDSFGHASILAYKSMLGWKNFNRFFKFAFVRNPWSRLYSAYCFETKGGFGLEADRIIQRKIGPVDFSTFVKRRLPLWDLEEIAVFRPQYRFVCDDQDTILLDRICRFERMREEFEALQKILGFENALPHLNATKIAIGYVDAYDDEMIQIVGNLYQEDVELFGYDFV